MAQPTSQPLRLSHPTPYHVQQQQQQEAYHPLAQVGLPHPAKTLFQPRDASSVDENFNQTLNYQEDSSMYTNRNTVKWYGYQRGRHVLTFCK